MFINEPNDRILDFLTRQNYIDMLLMLDNYDSFTYNLVQYFSELGEDVQVVKNDQITIDDIKRLKPKRVVISPGPCTPNEAGISLEVLETFYDTVPILGICLGHQCLGQVFGANVIKAKQVVHGKTSEIFHNQQGLFKGIKNHFRATRYHSLVLQRQSLPDCFDINAWTESDHCVDEIMGIQHKQWPLYGIQFHPESVLTEFGHQLLQNFLDQT